ncbi:CRISPR-associated helicase Cas3' [Ruminococcus sp.]
MNFTEQTLYSLMAKTGENSSEWLPLLQHLQDTADIMSCLCDEFLSPSFAKACGLEQEKFRKLAVFLAAVHDIGKAIVVFQYKIGDKLPDRKSALEASGINFDVSYDKEKAKQTPHALAGEEILNLLGCPKCVSAVVGSHHGVPAESFQDLSMPKFEIAFYENYYGRDKCNIKVLQDIWQTIFDMALEYAGFSDVSELPQIDCSAQMLLSGLLIMADWLASNTELFPLLSLEELKPTDPMRAEHAWERLDFPQMWKPEKVIMSDDDFKETFGFAPRSVQSEVLKTVENSENTGIYIFEAPMGCGKTETSLAASEILGAKFGKNGVFFGLPTQATANGIFPRILSWAETQSTELYHSVQLNHGSAALNPLFQNIQRGIPQEESDSGLIIHNWFCDSKKACLADFVTATVDQMLMLALKRKHVMLLHLGLSEKVVIIDEVHAYDAYMNEYLEMALQWLGSYKTPVILLSATLPSARRMSLIRAYLGIKKSDDIFEKEQGYPLLTWTDGKDIHKRRLSYDGAHKTVSVRKCADDVVVSLAKNVTENGGCVGIIVNTVRRAQMFAELLQDNAKVLLYHAQFVIPDRAKKEKQLVDLVGRESTHESRNGLVVVGTQVLEQSLDIDFDMLITDMCPIDLLLQRMGRLHRHDRGERPDTAQTPVCYVVTDEYTDKHSASRKIYSDWLINKTFDILPDSIILPDDISPLVQEVYNATGDDKNYDDYINKQKNSIGRADSFRISKPKRKSIHCMLSKPVETDDEQLAQAAVRDGISSFDVLLMQLSSDEKIHFLPDQYGGAEVSEYPDDEECRRIAEQKLRLPTMFCQSWNIDKNIRELENNCMKYIAGWKKSSWLKGQLVLFLDDDLNGELDGYDLHYSFENGLEFTKKEECE